MSLEQYISAGGTLVYDPTVSSLTPDEFLSAFGETVDSIAIVAKSEAGSTYFPSTTAPKDPRYGEIFSSFTQIATDIGIDVHAVLHGNVDAFFSRDPNFKMHHSSGDAIDNFVCPNQENYWLYLSEIAAEIASKTSVSGIILSDVLYPRDTSCFCENCRRTFSNEANISRDFSLETVKKREDLLGKWHEFRQKAIRSMLSSVVTRIHQEKKLEVITEILLDPQTDYFKGANDHFGHSLTTLTQVSPHLLLHLFPWTTMPTTEADAQQLVGNMKPIIDRVASTKNSLIIWEPDGNSFNLLLQLKQAIKSEYIFFTESKPRSYLDRRTLHLQLGV